jgi:hypothetical protein
MREDERSICLMLERRGPDCDGAVEWKGKLPPGNWVVNFFFGDEPYSYECLDFDSDWP